MLKSKRKGKRREKQAAEMLRKQGYYVIESRGSFGIWDLIAYNTEHARLIQVKSNRKPSPEAIDIMRGHKTPPHFSKEIWIFHDRGKLEIINLEIVSNSS
jgi:hypothetical protein